MATSVPIEKVLKATMSKATVFMTVVSLKLETIVEIGRSRGGGVVVVHVPVFLAHAGLGPRALRKWVQEQRTHEPIPTTIQMK